ARRPARAAHQVVDLELERPLAQRDDVEGDGEGLRRAALLEPAELGARGLDVGLRALERPRGRPLRPARGAQLLVEPGEVLAPGGRVGAAAGDVAGVQRRLLIEEAPGAGARPALRAIPVDPRPSRARRSAPRPRPR